MEFKVEDKPIHSFTNFRESINSDWKCKCTCGATWTQNKDKTLEDLFDIFKRHVRIFEKRIEVL